MAEVELVLSIVAVREVARARAFYGAVLGWAVAVETPVYVELRSPRGARLGLYQRDGFARNVGRTPIAAQGEELHAAELYFAAEDPGAALDRAVAAGGRWLSPLAPRPWGDEVGYVADPDGHVVAIASR